MEVCKSKERSPHKSVQIAETLGIGRFARPLVPRDASLFEIERPVALAARGLALPS